jgi:hypothetical protein
LEEPGDKLVPEFQLSLDDCGPFPIDVVRKTLIKVHTISAHSKKHILYRSLQGDELRTAKREPEFVEPLLADMVNATTTK